MDVTSIICEYNLFHNGHLRQIETIRSEYPGTIILALMSGNFVQRGEPAILPKLDRAAAAVLCGADLVLELPFPYSASSAEYFAKGAVAVLNELNCVTRINFGSESADMFMLSQTAKRMSSPEFVFALEESQRQHRSAPTSFIKLQEALYLQMYGNPLADSPNDILAIEYLRALSESDSNVKATTIKRLPGFSATKTRAALRAQNKDELESMVPKKAFEIYNSSSPHYLKNAERAVLAFFRLTPVSVLKQFADVNDGLEYRLRNAADKAESLEEFYSLLSTKKYTDAKLRRVSLNCMLGITEKQLKSKPLYTNLLAANSRGRELLRTCQKTSSIVIITKPAHFKRENAELRDQYQSALKAEALYALLGKTPLPSANVLREVPVII